MQDSAHYDGILAYLQGQKGPVTEAEIGLRLLLPTHVVRARLDSLHHQKLAVKRPDGPPDSSQGLWQAVGC